MKKTFATIFLYFLILNPASAIITTEEAISPDVLLIRGYSPESARIINHQHMSINNMHDTYAETQPVRWKTKYKPVNLVINYFLDGYVGSDDGLFGRHVINPSVRWDDI